jgi:tetratricopeptide (TPR) repeat protein
MKPSRTVTLTASVLLLAAMTGSILLLRAIDRARSGATLQEVLYISSPRALKRLSLGYSGLMADIYWTRAVQYFGGQHHVGATRYALLGPLLEITTALDPKLLVAYEYGSNFLAANAPLGAGQPKEAVKLIQNGIRNNPDDWHLYYNLGFIYYMNLKDYKAAADAFAQGSKLPNAHPFMKIMAANMAAHAGDVQMARMMWITTYESSTDEQIRANAIAHLRAMKVDQEVSALNTIVARYENRTGQIPSSFADLIRAGVLRGIPVDPLGQPYKLTSDGSVVVTDPDNLPFITAGLPLGYVPPDKPKLLPVK